MSDLEQDLRAAAYHLGAAIPYLQRTGRTLSAMDAGDELASIEVALSRMGADPDEGLPTADDVRGIFNTHSGKPPNDN